MGKSVLVFVSHSSEDKKTFIEPLVQDLENCYINVWFDKRNILPGDNLRRSIFRDGLDKADVALIFFTQQSLKSSWVDREIKHALREESKKGNNFDLNKIISIFDSQETYNEIANRYPELTDDLLLKMPENYDKIQLGQLISAIWSKYLSLQGGDVETQRQFLEKDKEIFQKEKEITNLQKKLEKLDSDKNELNLDEEFRKYYDSGLLSKFIEEKSKVLAYHAIGEIGLYKEWQEAIAFGLLEYSNHEIIISEKGIAFFKWYFLNIERKN